MTMQGPTVEPRSQSGRERLLSTARALFVRHGASNVGINDVTAAAGVARMTLYNNFPSKEALTQAVYEEMTAQSMAELQGMDRRGKSEEQRIHDLFDHFDSRTQVADYRGCPFIHASLQAADPAGPIHDLVSSYKRALGEHVLSLLAEHRADRTELADVILILLDGVVTEAYLNGVDHPANAAKRAVSILLKARS